MTISLLEKSSVLLFQSVGSDCNNDSCCREATCLLRYVKDLRCQSIDRSTMDVFPAPCVRFLYTKARLCPTSSSSLSLSRLTFAPRFFSLTPHGGVGGACAKDCVSGRLETTPNPLQRQYFPRSGISAQLLISPRSSVDIYPVTLEPPCSSLSLLWSASLPREKHLAPRSLPCRLQTPRWRSTLRDACCRSCDAKNGAGGPVGGTHV